MQAFIDKKGVSLVEGNDEITYEPLVIELRKSFFQQISEARRHSGTTNEAAYSRDEIAQITSAFDLAIKVHSGQKRRTGEPYISHPSAVASIMIELGLDTTTVVAALLHDAVEDTELSLETVGNLFGHDVEAIVDGVTKLDRIHFDSRAAQQAATMRKMLVAMAKDWRVLLIKLGDRLHNLRTISVMQEWKQRRIAQETLDIYAPLAHRLGMSELKWQLEDLSFTVLHPRRYDEIAQMVEKRAPERQEYLDRIIPIVLEQLNSLGVEAEVTGRPKHLWSIYEKMVIRGKGFDEINDLVGIRIITQNERECWAAIGVIHSLWNPVVGRFKDYINAPKFNLYQSLHTTVIGPEGKPIEVQIRTWDMHWRAEYGIAAHWGYKENSIRDNRGSIDVNKEELAWLKRIVDLERDTPDPVEFLESLKLDLDQGEVYIFTPKGEVITLPDGATPIDFAYAIHTEIGHRCVGAKINGRLASLDSKLASGDAVEIFTTKGAGTGPSRDWLSIAVSSRAKSKIRQWFTRERREDAIEMGKEEVAKAARRISLPMHKISGTETLDQVLEDLHMADLDSVFVAIGEGHLSARAFVERIAKELKGGDHEELLPATALGSTPHSTKAVTGIYVEGLDDVMVRLSRCCLPVPGDEVIGFVTRGRGVSVHRADCSNATSLAGNQQERMIEVEWDANLSGVFGASVEIRALDRAGLLADVTRTMSEQHVNIISASTQTGADRIARLRFEFELADRSHLDSVVRALRRIDSVYDAYRVLPGKSR
ncbi:MAG: bifunctional (p)ppGpp synthetase/guanosine-3',5'-bis(diphosphate) 3'-pyrophosphohydrolase [Acidimicrobiales bacterium]|nr:bifunctional (p)ppGpp synthetase/guanosine-3',5'-bis(diphosphate) 3'-pyrophosphohydrolase [Acidimicrobiales bacterium]